MDRLDHLKQTLPLNLPIIRRHNCNIVILDYNCPQGTYGWVLDNFNNEIKSRKIRLFREKSAKVYSQSKAKNLSHILAGESEYLVNLDGDNIMSVDFPQYISALFSQRDSIGVIRPSDVKTRIIQMGRMAVRREDFYKVRGYRECLTAYGNDDNDLKLRILMTGRTYCDLLTTDSSLDHTDELRVKHLPKLSIHEATQGNVAICDKLYETDGCFANVGVPWGVADVYSVAHDGKETKVNTKQR